MPTSGSRPIIFVAAAVLVFGVLAMLYFSETPSGKAPDAPPSETDDSHSEIEWLEKLWEEHPGHAPIALQLGNLHAAQGNNPAAIKYYREFLKLDTSATGWQVRLDIAKALHSMGQPSQARAEIQWVLSREPDHAGALYNMGAIEANLGNSAAAREYWGRLIAQHPQDTLAQFAERSIKLLQ